MWVADSDYATAPCVTDAMRKAVDIGVFCYGFDREGYANSVCWWMQTRHGWDIEPDWILTTQGLGHAIASCIDVWTEPGEGVAYFTPVYHEFRLKTERAKRTPVELPLALVGDRYELDLDAADAAITPDTKVLLFCSPQNPSGRIWTPDELRAVAAFAERHNLILVSDEVHADLVYEGGKHVPTDIAAPAHRDRTVTLFAASKTFNLAGLRVGQMIIPNADLRAQVAQRLIALNYDPTSISVLATQAAFSPDGNKWLQEQMAHLTANRDLFDAGINAIPGLKSMRLQATYLPWVDFSGTGMEPDEIAHRVLEEAKVGVAPGRWFGTGGSHFHRFNLAVPRSRVEETIERMQNAFRDLQ
jgi:cystathionine beta-lyase